MTAPTTINQDLFLRVKPGSSVDRMLTEMKSGKVFTGDEVIELGGQKQSPWILASLLPSNFDNVTVTRPSRGPEYIDGTYQLHFTDVLGRNAGVSVHVAKADISGTSGALDVARPDEDFEPILWPSAPRLIEPMGFFRKPNWYSKVSALVTKAGKHVSLAGPPGVGKDTAVMQMAAEARQPLVVVGGDAGLRKRDLVGTPELRNGHSVFQVAEFAAAVVNGWWAVITEVNAAEPDALLLLNGILEAPHSIQIHGANYPVHPNFRLFISYNPGLIGTKPLPQSFKDRFYPVQVGFLSEFEMRTRLESYGMPVSDSLDKIVINGEERIKDDWPTMVVKYGQTLWEAHEGGRLGFQVTLRRLKDAVDLMNLGLVSDVKSALREAVNDAIDSPIQRKVADKILSDLIK